MTIVHHVHSEWLLSGQLFGSHNRVIHNITQSTINLRIPQPTHYVSTHLMPCKKYILYIYSIVYSKKQLFMKWWFMYLFTCICSGKSSCHTVIWAILLYCIAHVSAEARAGSRRSPVEWRPRAQSQPNLRRGGRPRWAPACDIPHVRYFQWDYRLQFLQSGNTGVWLLSTLNWVRSRLDWDYGDLVLVVPWPSN